MSGTPPSASGKDWATNTQPPIAHSTASPGESPFRSGSIADLMAVPGPARRLVLGRPHCSGRPAAEGARGRTTGGYTDDTERIGAAAVQWD